MSADHTKLSKAIAMLAEVIYARRDCAECAAASGALIAVAYAVESGRARELGEIVAPFMDEVVRTYQAEAN